MRALGSAYYFQNSFFAGGIHVTSLVAWVSVRADRLRVIGCLRALSAGRRQLRRPGLHKQGLQGKSGYEHPNMQLGVPDHDSGPQKKWAVQAVTGLHWLQGVA